MSQTSLIIGLLSSIALHAVLLLPGSPEELLSRKKTKATIKPANKVALRLSPKTPAQRQPQSDRHLEKNESKMRDLEKVAEPLNKNLAGRIGDLSPSGDDGRLPPLRLVWDSPRQLIEISKALGMRILAIRSNQLIGEVSLQDAPHIKSFDGELSGFSNRVRTIPPQFFGPAVLRTSDEPVESFWVLVPSNLDRQWVSIQKEAMQSSRIPSSELSYMEARIVPGELNHGLVITKIVKS